jgi:hypothetical protein
VSDTVFFHFIFYGFPIDRIWLNIRYDSKIEQPSERDYSRIKVPVINLTVNYVVNNEMVRRQNLEAKGFCLNCHSLTKAICGCEKHFAMTSAEELYVQFYGSRFTIT